MLGVAFATNSVAVTNTLTGAGGISDRKMEYFHRELTVNNTNAPLWQSLSVTSAGTVSNGSCAFPAYTESLTYDTDGNLTFDGTWTYEWDAENRLAAMSMTNISNIANSNRFRLEFVYDSQSRRVSKLVKTWNGSAFAIQYTNRFVYDGWNVIAILSSQSTSIQSFTWGLDLSGTFSKGGGVAGLLFCSTPSISASNTFVAYDGNGNITALVAAGTMSVAGRYEYSSFGNILRKTGDVASQVPFRFSTKFYDDEGGIICFPTRQYSPVLGRWLSRDPLHEAGGLNLYAFVGNNPVQRYDPLGRTSNLDVGAAGAVATGLAASEGQNLAGYLEEAAETSGLVSELSELEAVAGEAEDHLVLGFRALVNGTRDLATRINARHLLDTGDTYRQLFQEALKNPNLKISINMNGMDGLTVESKLLEALSRDGHLNWEIKELFEAGKLGSTTLYINGEVVQNPWAGILGL